MVTVYDKRELLMKWTSHIALKPPNFSFSVRKKPDDGSKVGLELERVYSARIQGQLVLYFLTAPYSGKISITVV